MRRSQALQVLGIEGDPSKSVIKQTYHRLALSKHPDKRGGSKEAFQDAHVLAVGSHGLRMVRFLVLRWLQQSGKQHPWSHYEEDIYQT